MSLFQPVATDSTNEQKILNKDLKGLRQKQGLEVQNSCSPYLRKTENLMYTDLAFLVSTQEYLTWFLTLACLDWIKMILMLEEVINVQIGTGL